MNMGVVLRPFRENRLRFELAPNLTYLQPAEDHMGILFFGVEREMFIGLLHTAKPAEEQEKVSLSNTVVEKMGAGRISLTKHGQPARLSDKVTSDKVGVQMAIMGPFYPGFLLPMVEAQVFHH